MQRNSQKFISSHEDLEVYPIAFDTAMEIFELAKNFPKEEKYSLTDTPVNKFFTAKKK